MLVTKTHDHQALAKFPLMGFDIARRSAIIYDSGTEQFTGTTLEGIGQAVLGVMRQPAETANRFVSVQSIRTCQQDLLRAFQDATGGEWETERSTVRELLEGGRAKHQAGDRGWVLPLVVAQLFDPGEGRGTVGESRQATQSDLLGVVEESPRAVVHKALAVVES